MRYFDPTLELGLINVKVIPLIGTVNHPAKFVDRSLSRGPSIVPD